MEDRGLQTRAEGLSAKLQVVYDTLPEDEREILATLLGQAAGGDVRGYIEPAAT